MNKRLRFLLPLLIFFGIALIIAKPYLLQKKVLFPGNLFYSFYQPYASYPLPEYPSGPPNKPVGFDNLRIFYPLRNLAIDQIKHGQIPLWNPYNFAGNTLLATYQSAIFHPLSFLFFILPQIDAWSIISLLIPFFAAMYMYFFLKELQLSYKASIFGAITYGFSGFFLVSMQESFMNGYSALVLPLILLGIYKLSKKVSLSAFIFTVIGFVWSIFSGWFQMTLYLTLVSIIWSIFLYRSNISKKYKNLLYLVAAFIIAGLIAGIHLLPGFEAFIYSARGTTDAKFLFDTYLVPWYHLITYLAPDFFGNPGTYNYFGQGFFYEEMLFVGIPGIIFGIYQVLRYRQLMNIEKFFLWLWLISLSLGMYFPTSWFILYSLKLPFISTILPSRIFFISTFALAVSGAYGIQHYLKNPAKKSTIFSLIIPTLAILFEVIYIFAHKLFHIKLSHFFYLVSIKNLIIPSIFLCICWAVLLLGLIIKIRKFIYLSF